MTSPSSLPAGTPATHDQARDALLQWVSLQSGVPAERLGVDYSLLGGDLLDSFALLLLYTYVEELLGRKLADDEYVMDDFRTIARIVERFFAPTPAPAAAPRLVMVGGWTDIYEKAKACGYHLTLVQTKSDITPRDLEVADEVHSIRRDDPFVVDLARTLHAREPFALSLSFTEYGLLNAARIGAELGLPGNPLQPVELTRDKGRMREHLRETGVATVPFTVAHDVDDILRLGQEAGWPLILKPVMGTGSSQIHKLAGPADAAPALESIRAEYTGQAPIAERFVEGVEVSVEAFSWQGRHRIVCVTDKHITGAPTFVETGHDMPSCRQQAELAALAEVTTRFLDAIGHRHGPSHTELILSASGPVIVESHTRTGGDRIFEMVELAFDFDMFSNTMLAFAGRLPAQAMDDTPARRGAAIRFLCADRDGVLEAVEGVEVARALPGVVRVDVGAKPGQRVHAVRHSTHRLGYVLTTGADRAEAVANVERALAELRVHVSVAS